jgi:hypothetical protein
MQTEIARTVSSHLPHTRRSALGAPPPHAHKITSRVTMRLVPASEPVDTSRTGGAFDADRGDLSATSLDDVDVLVVAVVAAATAVDDVVGDAVVDVVVVAAAAAAAPADFVSVFDFDVVGECFALRPFFDVGDNGAAGEIDDDDESVLDGDTDVVLLFSLARFGAVPSSLLLDGSASAAAAAGRALALGGKGSVARGDTGADALNLPNAIVCGDVGIDTDASLRSLLLGPSRNMSNNDTSPLLSAPPGILSASNIDMLRSL